MRGFSFEKAPLALLAPPTTTTATAMAGTGSSSSLLAASVPRPLPVLEGGGSGVVEGGGADDLGLFHLHFGQPRLEGLFSITYFHYIYAGATDDLAACGFSSLSHNDIHTHTQAASPRRSSGAAAATPPPPPPPAQGPAKPPPCPPRSSPWPSSRPRRARRRRRSSRRPTRSPSFSRLWQRWIALFLGVGVSVSVCGGRWWGGELRF